MSISARVINGKTTVEEPTELPEGTVLDLVLDDGGDDLDEEERTALNAHLARAYAQIQQGKGRPAADVLADLRTRR